MPARTFNGTNQVVNMGAGSVLNIAAGAQMSLMCWVNFASFPGSQATFLSKGFDGSQTAYNFAFVPGTPNKINWGSTSGNASWTTTWKINEWHHCYGEYDGTQFNLYSDGVLVQQSGANAGPRSTPTRFFAAGAIDINGSFGQFSPVCMADAALFNGPLLPSEIIRLGNGSLRPSEVTSKTRLGYWLLNGTSSPELDQTSNANNGTVTGTNPSVCGSSPSLGALLTLMGSMCQ